VIYGDELETSARVVEIRTNSTGRTVVVRADVYRKKHAIVTILSSFLFRGNSLSTELDFSINTLGRSREDISEIEMNETEIEILHKKSWFTSKNIPSSSFSTVSFAELNIERGFQKCKVSGDVYALSGKEERINIGTVHYSSSDSDRNPVVEYLQRVSSRTKSDSKSSFYFENGGRYLLSKPEEIISPSECDSYAQASGDLNPIHSKRYGDAFVKLANLPSAIVSSFALVPNSFSSHLNESFFYFLSL